MATAVQPPAEPSNNDTTVSSLSSDSASGDDDAIDLQTMNATFAAASVHALPSMLDQIPPDPLGVDGPNTACTSTYASLPGEGKSEGEGKMEFQGGHLAMYADGACVVRVGDLVVSATALASKTHKLPHDASFRHTVYIWVWRWIGCIEWMETVNCIVHAPTHHTLHDHHQVEFRDRPLAAGILPAQAQRRKNISSDEELRIADLILRAVRPRIPLDFLDSIRLQTTVLSQGEAAVIAEVAAINATSAALLVSDIPWEGPVAAVALELHEDGGWGVYRRGGKGKQRAGARMMVVVHREDVVLLDVAV